MSCWLSLCHLSPSDAVQHVRLQCVPALQRALDARFSEAQWSALSPDEALDAVGKVVLRSSNQAVVWSEFFDVVQGPEEPISSYFVRCSQKVADCGFQCPSCNSDISEYILLRKLMVGLRDQVMKRYVYQSCDTFTSVDHLRSVCSTFEAARRDAVSPTVQCVSPRTAGNDVTEGLVEVAASRGPSFPGPPMARPVATAEACMHRVKPPALPGH